LQNYNLTTGLIIGIYDVKPSGQRARQELLDGPDTRRLTTNVRLVCTKSELH